MKTILRLTLMILAMSMLPSALQAQAEQSGTVQQLDQDGGFITISGRKLRYSDHVTQVFLDDRQVGSDKLDVGMLVRFSLDGKGVLLRVEVVGPRITLEKLEQS